ncbi:response regulator transcription factor [Bacillus pseudomycoides]|uniref:DNA-binding response regulator n=2 Tax=Bacillaceae TaxID=186817 RepID=A0AAJ1Z568_9BACI|nr:response regulator transcription factor [Bacillus pseudomycoides]EEM01982.1 Response regulator receiver [Bacillus pseudomycoides]MDR4188001.1 response regulator transcription factor [Bacillus pseudomycoides]MDR4328939.1 response regulator transcription factor [Bacillus pseudomycoides]PDZ73089.1 DNA-binding response regulator [Bacillus pseudomycoides]PEF21768.1 DNA-binding response regulator [Bacillus pseudomycoides]
MLVDDQPIIRQGLTYIFNSQSDMEVVGEADNGKDAVKIVLRCIPDIVLMDVQMPQATGIDATRNIVQSLPDTKIILLTTFDVQDYVFDGIRAGAAGYLLKDTQTKELLDGVRSIQRGATLYNSMTAKQALAKIINSRDNISTNQPKASSFIEPLTDREIEILQLIAYGKKNKEIANILYISEGIVKTHVHNINQKLEVTDRTQAVVLGICMQLVR